MYCIFCYHNTRRDNNRFIFVLRCFINNFSKINFILLFWCTIISTVFTIRTNTKTNTKNKNIKINKEQTNFDKKNNFYQKLSKLLHLYHKNVYLVHNKPYYTIKHNMDCLEYHID